MLRAKLARSAVAIVVASASGIGVIVATAEPASAGCFAAKAADTQATTSAMNIETAKMHQAGKSQADIEKVLNEKYHLIKISGGAKETTVVIESTSSLNIGTPSIWYDNCTGKYTAMATWQWNSLSGIDDWHPFGCNGQCNIGDEDAFGIAFNRTVTAIGGYSAVTCGNGFYYGCAERMHVDDANWAGVGYAGQDTQYWSAQCCLNDYNFWYGQVVYTISNPGCGSLQAISKYGHTWSSTRADVTVGVPLSVNITFTSSSNRWYKSGQPSNAVYPC